MTPIKLSSFQNGWYSPGRPRWQQAAWYFLGLPLLRCAFIPSSGFRAALLRLFGARVGAGVVIKPGVRVKYPWRLEIGGNSWIGEDCWIDNMADVSIGHDACLSQDSYFCTGNHDWSDPSFGLIVRPIRVEDGAWIGARATVCPGIMIGECAVLAAGGVAVRDIPAYEIHGGNPAAFLRHREIRTGLTGSLLATTFRRAEE